MKIKLFPHFYRIFSAGFFSSFRLFSFWVVIAVFFIAMPSFDTSLPSLYNLEVALLKEPENPSNHLSLAKKYVAANDLQNAKREVLIGLGYTPENRDLKKELEEINDLLARPQKISLETNEWEKIVKDFPGYRDAYLKLTRLYLSVYRDDEAKKNLEKALNLDPNFEPAKELGGIVNNQSGL